MFWFWLIKFKNPDINVAIFVNIAQKKTLNYVETTKIKK